MRHYCTLFNMKYAAKGMALYESLARHSSEEFVLWVLPMDEETKKFLDAHSTLWPKMVILDPTNVFDSKFARATLDRTVAYTCFTATAWLMQWLLDRAHLKTITYLDSDLCFYSDPKLAFDELGDKSVGIVPHRFMPHDVERLSPNGWFNVSWVTIKQDPIGAPILARWREQCLEKCDRESCGDQKYLDEWPHMFKGEPVCLFEHEGIGVAPWNAMAYQFLPGPQIAVHRGSGFGTWAKKPVVFYHFHELQRKAKNDYTLTGYPLPDACKKLIYEPYIAQLELGETIIDDWRKQCESTPSVPKS